MNHGSPFAVDGDDGPGCGLHVRARSRKPSSSACNCSPRFRLLPARRRPFLVVGRPSRHPRLRRLPASWFAASRCVGLRACSARGAPLGALEGLQVGIGHGGVASTHGPAFGALSRRRCPPACLRQPFQQRGIGQIHARIAFRRQGRGGCRRPPVRRCPARRSAPADAGRRRFRARSGVRAGCGRMARCHCGRIVERGFLRGVVVGDGKGHQLVSSRHRRDSRPSGAARRSPASSGAAPPAA